MQLFKSGIKSNKIATLAGLVLAVTYLLPEFIERTFDTQSTSFSLSKTLFTKSVPVPVRKPGDMPTLEQPDQFDMASLNTALNTLDYRLQDIRNGDLVPRFYVDQIPVDIVDIEDVSKRKSTFIKVVLPLVLSANERIMERRERLKGLINQKMQGKSLPPADRKWLEEMATRYRGDPANPERLLVKVDRVPVSMALAQAVEESGWGTSRFAREGNALFGQRVWVTGRGIVPEDRAENETYEVKAFKSIADSIRAYIQNLNSHPAYAEFRKIRARQYSNSGATPNGLTLIDTLHVYSEKGQEYVKNLRSLIEINQLSDFEDATLAPERLAANRT
ncbi:glucosaminidase domain-containing protein [Sneathiella litorea]|uniref:Mannosyl-glycoprotein endo-beta-N-acetylglucosamidase-like domain-containing protein n=1 Tax=Sneathiella litorea TaxID=2606216 RepID=A0A6L8W3B3_9PROT|nr:glucosaminidase domain-containing protein [Sneathiella litorea]MZR29575.1 hypothetical protein [Sneathiella litorea]